MMIRHILIQDQNSNCNIAMAWVPEGKRRRGRPKTTWRRTKERKKERKKGAWELWDEVRTKAANRKK
ncbi:unnamed protein product [Porites evermanni]|uniref:Uncharacterized protein n=1 Tax=Porites evermanni TaxID=104178 RepID=A0ABN8MGW2_9CNID|nr:unnamed protein product [Porites evermanni]